MTESIAAQMNSNIDNYYELGRETSGLRGATIDRSDEDVVEVRADSYQLRAGEGHGGKKAQSNILRVSSRCDDDSDLVEIEQKRQALLAKLRGIKGTG